MSQQRVPCFRADWGEGVKIYRGDVLEGPEDHVFFQVSIYLPTQSGFPKSLEDRGYSPNFTSEELELGVVRSRFIKGINKAVHGIVTGYTSAEFYPEVLLDTLKQPHFDNKGPLATVMPVCLAVRSNVQDLLAAMKESGRRINLYHQHIAFESKAIDKKNLKS